MIVQGSQAGTLFDRLRSVGRATEQILREARGAKSHIIALQAIGRIERQLADRLIDSITERFFLLGRHLHLGRACDEELRRGLRSVPVGEYVILYCIEDKDAVILRVVRGSRNIAALFDRGCGRAINHQKAMRQVLGPRTER